MADKETCPGCESHLSSIARAFQDGADCPECGLSANAAAEIKAIRGSRADEAVKRRVSELLAEVDALKAENYALRRFLGEVESTMSGWRAARARAEQGREA